MPLILIIYISMVPISGTFIYGALFGNWLGTFKHVSRQDAGALGFFALALGVLGPIGIIGAVFATGFLEYGIHFRNPPKP